MRVTVFSRTYDIRSGDTKWEDHVAALRYIDDLLLISNVYCSSCLASIVKDIDPIVFDIASQGRFLQWLDLTFYLDNGAIDYLSKEFFIPPPWGTSVKYSRAYILSRISRWKEISLSVEQLVSYMAAIIVDLKSCGWQRQHFRYVLHTVKGKPKDLEIQLLCCALEVAQRR
eukprot:gnl/MRDRNA2_/MRDRNA2_478694_c0_seq1.p1 gnl/MRDRNA2_/MRDRNA2_478694_c0~~gnl/MRDRNA2_/MRDRNA2_478694_c0_seq1.p1  ORF type:complete len:171 (-),score=14.16 gnl/MRDRNA2_/MRDRNA2_478694_c0_seq1:70-582(-)